MLFYNIIKILDKSKAENIDVLVARDKIVAEENISFEEMKVASDFINAYYNTITKCRRLDDNYTIKLLIDADEKRKKEIVKEVEDRVEK